MLKKSKILWNKISRIKKVCDKIERQVDENEKNFLFFAKLSLDYEYAIRDCGYVPVVKDHQMEIKKIFEQSQKYLKKRAYYIRKLQLLQRIIADNNLSMFISMRKINEKSYYDNLL